MWLAQNLSETHPGSHETRLSGATSISIRTSDASRASSTTGSGRALFSRRGEEGAQAGDASPPTPCSPQEWVMDSLPWHRLCHQLQGDHENQDFPVRKDAKKQESEKILESSGAASTETWHMHARNHGPHKGDGQKQTKARKISPKPQRNVCRRHSTKVGQYCFQTRLSHWSNKADGKQMLPSSRKYTQSFRPIPTKGRHIPLGCLGVKSIWDLLSAQEARRGRWIQLHHWGLSFLLHHWDQEDLGVQRSPV